MQSQRSTVLSRLVQKIAPSRTGSRIFSRILRPLDTLLYNLSHGKWTFTGLGRLPVILVTTTGARSGRPRTVPLLAIYDRQDPSVFALVASNFGQKNYPAWYHNLKAHPAATCSIGGKAREYIAHEAEGEEYLRFWQYAEDVYIGYPNYKRWASHRRIPIMVMTPME